MKEKKIMINMFFGFLLYFAIWICEIAIQRGCLWAIYEPEFPKELEEKCDER